MYGKITNKKQLFLLYMGQSNHDTYVWPVGGQIYLILGPWTHMQMYNLLGAIKSTQICTFLYENDDKEQQTHCNA